MALIIKQFKTTFSTIYDLCVSGGGLGQLGSTFMHMLTNPLQTMLDLTRGGGYPGSFGQGGGYPGGFTGAQGKK